MSLVGAQRAPASPGRGNRLESGIIAASSWLRAAIGWQLLALLAVSAIALLAAYQVERPIRINIGGAHETPFVANFHTKNVADDDATHYRWTSATSFVIFKGIGGGRERTGMCASAPAGRPASYSPSPCSSTASR